MNEINRITTRPAAPAAATRAATAAQGRETAPQPAAGRPAGASGADQVELSDRARLLSKLQETPEIRAGLVNQIKAEIEQGTYETPDKIDSAADNLLDDLDTFG